MNRSELDDLARDYEELKNLDGFSPQSRGQRFDIIVGKVLRAHGCKVDVKRLNDDEIDVVIEFQDHRYLLEAKWENAPIGEGPIIILRDRVQKRLAGTIGLCLSMSGYKSNVKEKIVRAHRLEVLLLDRTHFEALLYQFIDIRVFFKFILDGAHFDANPYPTLVDITSKNKISELDILWKTSRENLVECLNSDFELEELVSGMKVQSLNGISETEFYSFGRGDTYRINTAAREKIVHIPSIPYVSNRIDFGDGYFFTTDRSVGHISPELGLRKIVIPEQVPNKLIGKDDKKILVFSPDNKQEPQLLEIDRESFAVREISFPHKERDICLMQSINKLIGVDPHNSTLRVYTLDAELEKEFQLNKITNPMVFAFSSTEVILRGEREVRLFDFEQETETLLLRSERQFGYKFAEAKATAMIYLSLFGDSGKDYIYSLRRRSVAKSDSRNKVR